MKVKKTAKRNDIERKKAANAPQSRLKPKVGQVLDLTITTLDEEGFGLALHETTRIRVAGVLPGETVRAKVTFSGQRDTFAETLKILRHSPDRLAQIPCSLGNACEGCPLIQMKYRAQLDWKKNLVEGAMRRFPSLRAAEVRPPAPSGQALRLPHHGQTGDLGQVRLPRPSASTAATATRSWISATARSTIPWSTA